MKKKSCIENIWNWIFENVVFLNPKLWPYRETFGRILGVGVAFSFVSLKSSSFVAKIWTIQNEEISSFILQTGEKNIGYVDVEILIWVLEICIILGYILVYLLRKRAKNIAFGFKEVVYPFFVATLPLFVLFAPENLFLPQYQNITIILGFGLILFGGIINFLGIWQLRSAFSVMVEARTLVNTGLYRYIRHPIYTGHFLLFLGILCFHFFWQTALCYLFFIIAQTYRAKIEEQKLEKTFPKYKKYKEKTGMFFPV